jgi:hypothetical protein
VVKVGPKTTREEMTAYARKNGHGVVLVLMKVCVGGGTVTTPSR